jgi:hypothetical protein
MMISSHLHGTREMLGNNQNKSIAANHIYPEHEQQEKFMISEPHTVVHPRTMVIHLHYTSIAETTVVRAHRLEGSAPLAKFAILLRSVCTDITAEA